MNWKKENVFRGVLQIHYLRWNENDYPDWILGYDHTEYGQTRSECNEGAAHKFRQSHVDSMWNGKTEPDGNSVQLEYFNFNNVLIEETS